LFPITNGASASAENILAALETAEMEDRRYRAPQN